MMVVWPWCPNVDHVPMLVGRWPAILLILVWALRGDSEEALVALCRSFCQRTKTQEEVVANLHMYKHTQHIITNIVRVRTT